MPAHSPEDGPSWTVAQTYPGGVVFGAIFPILLLLTVVRDHVPDVIVKLFGPVPDASLTQL